MVERKRIRKIIKTVLEEDIGSGDVTTLATIPEDSRHKAFFVAKESGIVAGLQIAEMTFKELDPKVELKKYLEDGDKVYKGDMFAEVFGCSRALLTGERTALNFLQRMSGIATETAKYVEAVKGTNAQIIDTRKTAPGLRVLDKWAVGLGGGGNHRMGLFDMALIKDNHIEAVGSITEAVWRVRWGHTLWDGLLEVEVKNLDELKEALDTETNWIMLDNMDTSTMAEAVNINNGKVKLEASGNITLENVRQVAQTGVEFISVGALTHSVKALDISLKHEALMKCRLLLSSRT